MLGRKARLVGCLSARNRGLMPNRTTTATRIDRKVGRSASKGRFHAFGEPSISTSYTLGVDPAKRKLTAALLSPDGQLLVRPVDFASDREGFERLLSVLREQVPSESRLDVGTEATASLDDNFLHWLGSLREDFDIISLRLDPAQVAHFSGARPIRGKTDSGQELLPGK